MKFIILVLTLQAHANLIHKASFAEDLVRYPSPYAILEQFHRIVPKPWDTSNSCFTIDENSAPLLGTNDPMQGPLEKNPGDFFYQYYQDCVRSIVTQSFQDSYSAASNSDVILGWAVTQKAEQVLVAKCTSTIGTGTCFPNGTIFSLWTDSWAKVPSDLQELIIARLINYLVGPESVLKDLNYIGKATVFRGVNIPDQDVLVKFFVKHMEKQPTLEEVYINTAIILRLGPALKN